MIDSLARFVTKNRLFVFIMVAALIGIGVRAVLNMPIEAFPDVQDVQVVIITQQPGQAPEEVERAVSLPIERALAGTPGVSNMRSVSITGLSVVTLIFQDGTDDYFARSQVLEKLRDADLPDGVVPSLAPLSTAVGEVYRYVIDKPAGMPLYEARAIQDFVIRPAIRMVPGVADVTSFGGSIKQYQIRIQPEALKRYGVTLADVETAVGNANSNVGGGIMRRGDEAVVVRGVGLYTGIDDVANTLVKAQNGRTVRVGDLGEVVIGTPERSGMVANDRQDDVSEGVVLMIKHQNAAEVVKGIKAAVDGLNSQFQLDARREGHAPLKIRATYQRTKLIDRTVETVAENLLVGAALVTAILLVFLRNWRAALAVAAIIPLALLAAFAGLYQVNVPANLISMGAVDFGIIIDSAVVLVEAMMVGLAIEAARHGGLLSNHQKEGVVRSTVGTLGKPILFSKAIIIMAFVPIFTFQRVEGKMFSPVALTLTFALLAALVLTLTFLPAVLSLLVTRHDMAEKHIAWMDRLRDRYRRVLDWAAPRDRLIFTLSIAALVVTGVLVPKLGSEFLPKLDEGNIWLTVQLAPSAAMETTRKVESTIRHIMLTYPEVRQVVSETGRPDDGTDPKGPSSLQMLIDLKPRDEWRAQFPTKEALENDMRRRVDVMPGVPTNFSQVIEDSVEESLSGVKGEISIKIFGPDLAVLEALADRTARVVAAVPGAADVAAIKVGGQSELRAVLDRAAMARLGLNPGDANAAIQAAFGGAVVGAAYEGDRKFDIVARFAEDQRNAVDDLAQLQIPLPAGGTVSLGEIARIDVRMGASRISREAGGRNVAVKANVSGRDQGGFVTDAQKAVAAQVRLPAGYRMTWGGQFENQQRAMKRLSIIVPIALLGIFALLFGAFKSVRFAAVILAMVPFTMIGGMAALGLAGLHLSVSAAVGFIAVVGISVQNGVVMLEHVTTLISDGMPIDRAILEGPVDRLRPLLMTALMAGLGLLPAALSTGIGSETQRPFACVIVGGIVSATLFMLVLLPLALRRLSRNDAGAQALT
ncbi:efflux RND transporter permease subunit [Polymorphobacter fuscus]|uniref:CusA/CzcA family heavy metal efflux RND transporter n=1 Tax=Sandarakinorhabdus fusca TaxID=1439888 RepID=A0A7C9GMT1_9SPHN|nr:CusA/CzcA family heavy metal efflux RND transporter [Polymorphobacter fuscus]KAB7648677.1 efflux RND transporter permease subunit [Polymorphobacter fuscus]MQT16237.1 CusA/CzcA family heavy metal efflux RND transporter [Polymorphobacter fuscus]